ncbi:hypothetical protein EJ05DRAFT_499387 [Pseudovirgaria hyperparasitica]|uniref:Uncharacterized protein n=1 Tax=Pseudovirgaria hyperparasitica TaxID=470096 RepID=A0A6A6WAH9_9PEZI|nr:uncharacterized protein EJ05DRAFT_499387 [Pseudovirgaria hyperparasitica]KAF2758960.1 hypothetical protein EJ05DRAFT_499387 [Pseudovirgaria hyperparasitica]
MPQKQLATSDQLRELLEAERARFTDQCVPLSTKQLQSLKRASEVAMVGEVAVQRNTPKKRARTILRELWANSPEIFVLCAIATSPSTLGELKASDYLQVLFRWWDDVHHPSGLNDLIKTLQHYLPSLSDNEDTERGERSASSPSLCATLSLSDLLSFLQALPHSGENDTTFMIHIPGDHQESPFIEISSEMCQGLVAHTLERTKETRFKAMPHTRDWT